MGDRVAIRFVNGEDKSIAYFAHWGGPDFYMNAQKFLGSLKPKTKGKSISTPLDRMEANTVMLNFVVWFSNEKLKEYPIVSSFYLGKDYRDGDCSDNGCYDIDTHTGDVVRVINSQFNLEDMTSRWTSSSLEDEMELRGVEYDEYKRRVALLPDYDDDAKDATVSKW